MLALPSVGVIALLGDMGLLGMGLEVLRVGFLACRLVIWLGSGFGVSAVPVCGQPGPGGGSC